MPQGQRGSRCPSGSQPQGPLFLGQGRFSDQAAPRGRAMSAHGVSAQQLLSQEMGSALTPNPSPSPTGHAFPSPSPRLGLPQNNAAGKGWFFMGFN